MRQTGIAGWSCSRSWRMGLTVVALTAGCTSMDEDPPGGGQCPVPLSYPEKKKRCYAAYALCLDSPIQSIRSKRYGHSQCEPCRDLCMRNNGVWPDAFEGVRCQ